MRGVHATGIAAAPDGSWIAADRLGLARWGALGLNDVERLPARAGRPLVDLAISVDGALVLSAPERYRLAADAWDELPPIGPLFEGLVDHPSGTYEIAHATWDAHGSVVAVCATFRPSRRQGAAGRGGAPAGRILVLDGETRAPRLLLADLAQDEPCGPMVIGPDYVAACAATLRVWDHTNGSSIVTRRWCATSILRAAPFRDRLLLATTADGDVLLADVRSWITRDAWPAHPGAARGLAPHPTRDELATGGDDGVVRRWSLGGNLLADVSLDGPIEALGYAADGARLAVAVGGPSPSLVRCRLDE